MNESSYLSPAKIREQCDAAIRKLQKDNEATEKIEKSIQSFVEDSHIKSEAFDALKVQMEDYKTVMQIIRLANQCDIEDFGFLKMAVGFQELDGGAILEQKNVCMSEKYADEESAERYRRKARKTKSATLRFQYNMKVIHYTEMADLDQLMYNQWQEKENLYDGIESMTSGLFADGTAIRATVENALVNIRGVFHNGVYSPDLQAPWRKEIEQQYKKLLLKLGYSEEELIMLEKMGVQLTYEDIRNLKSTIGTEKVICSNDYKSLLYQGKVYVIQVPRDGEALQTEWNLDKKKILTKTEFNWAAGILGINLEDIPKEKLFTHDNLHNLQGEQLSGKDKNTATAAALHAIMGIENFFVSSLSHTEIKLVFESSGVQRQVTLAVGDSNTRLKMQQIDYDMPINTYRDSKGVLGNKFASDYAMGIYKAITGKNVPNENATYTITGTLDEAHKDTDISGYLSYSKEGELLYTPLIYPGDTAYVSTCWKFSGYNAEEILEFTELLSNSVPADKEIKEILEKIMEEDKSGE